MFHWVTKRVVWLSVLAVIVVFATILGYTTYDAQRSTKASAPYLSVRDGAPATMEDYWNGKADWTFLRKDTQASTGQRSFFDGSQVVIMKDGTWYYFNRNFSDKYIKDHDFTCGNDLALETQVRKSTDKGATWSAPVIVIPVDATKPYACDATDGGVIYNEKENQWHYLFQCSDGNGWKGCALSREGADPMGPFTIEPPGGNPVIMPGQLWNQICTTAEKKCGSSGPRNVVDEGTYNIFKYDGSYYWVGFHGFDGRNGYRGIAKTADFRTWIAGDKTQGVPDDSVNDKTDMQLWRESWNDGKSVGGGAGSIIEDGGYYYQVVEGADITLSCTSGQHWDIGLYRTNSLASTNWEQFPLGNPIIYSSTAKENEKDFQPCNIQYAELFKDPNDDTIYLAYGRRSDDPNYDGLYTYRLEKKNNLLANGDLWRADTESWSKDGANTTMEASRIVNNSPDGTPYMALGCGGECEKASAVYQEVAIPRITDATLRFDGKFMSEEANGKLELTVIQMNANRKVLQSDPIAIDTTTAWASSGKSVSLLSGARLLRYEVKPVTGNLTYRADDMELRIFTEGERK